MQKYRYILFDLDGTLIYSHEGIFRCFRHALKEMGREEPSLEDLHKCIGPPLEYSFENFFNMDEETAVLATVKYRERYATLGVLENEPIEGVLEGLKRLKEKGYVLAMATSKPQRFAQQISQRWGFSPYLSVVVGCGLDGSFPTKASVIEEVLRRLNAPKEACLMVGDRKYDVEGARETGLDCALLKVGYAPTGEIEACKPDYVFNGFEDFTDFYCKGRE